MQHSQAHINHLHRCHPLRSFDGSLQCNNASYRVARDEDLFLSSNDLIHEIDHLIRPDVKIIYAIDRRISWIRFAAESIPEQVQSENSVSLAKFVNVSSPMIAISPEAVHSYNRRSTCSTFLVSYVIFSPLPHSLRDSWANFFLYRCFCLAHSLRRCGASNNAFHFFRCREYFARKAATRRWAKGAASSNRSATVLLHHKIKHAGLLSTKLHFFLEKGQYVYRIVV
mmetsp:Transcript_1475/g.3022  ORF Transcript_1475/g.3022 Transcript_1475/m.3022 type:complete len:226 (+) Transcript_1475:192-869(+)